MKPYSNPQSSESCLLHRDNGSFNPEVFFKVLRGEWAAYHVPQNPELREEYGYDPKMVEGVPSVTVHMEPGDLLVFSSKFLHSVRGIGADERHITLATFCGELPSGDLIVWA